MQIDVVTTFPELFALASPGVLGVSIPSRAVACGALRVTATDIRGFTTDKHRKTDDRPYGGGPGMVMMCQPVYDAVRAVEAREDGGGGAGGAGGGGGGVCRVLMTPQGVPLTQELVEELAGKGRLVVIAGHYEGIDERVVEELAPLEISIGDYVLSGGELAALVLIDAIARVLPTVLGDEQSHALDSFGRVAVPPPPAPSRRERSRRAREALYAGLEGGGADRGAGDVAARDSGGAADGGRADVGGAGDVDVGGRTVRLLDCPHYTKPREWMGRAVPEVLLSGDHARIEAWRLEQRLARTRQRRPDLLRGCGGGG